MQYTDPDEYRSWLIGPDLADEHDDLFTIDEDELPELRPAFDPSEFIKLNPDPKVGAWRLPEQTLYD